MSAADDMFAKAVDLLNAAQFLHRSHQDHAAFVCAIHAGINAADDIGHFEDDPYLGMEHRAAADHLRRLDIALARPAQSLGRLVDRKSTVEYREARFTRNQAGMRYETRRFWSGLAGSGSTLRSPNLHGPSPGR